MSWLLGQGKLETRWSDLAGDSPSSVSRQGEKRPHVAKRRQPVILFGTQDGHDPTAFGGQLRQELRRHPFPIDDEPPERPFVRRRFIPREQAWGAQGQVQVTPMGG